jgi:predicted enzyme related to lactoylglutathione lyase
MVGPVDIPIGRFAVLVDPTGAMFAVVALAAA